MKRKEEEVMDKEDEELNKAHNRALARLGREAREAYENRKYDGNFFSSGAYYAGGYCIYREEELIQSKNVLFARISYTDNAPHR